MSEHRPSPEELLLRVTEEEKHQARGKLKIYLGAAPGVGKTYTMLETALEKRATGLDVIVGLIETHGRQEIAMMLEGLELLPLKEIEYHNKKIKEFDLDAALKRQPALILVDELAHTNAPGSRHTKRWQDVKELIDRGIDVYTTLNVQHIESMNDIVAQITGVTVHETVPDSILEMADSIELVDLPPDELIKRLHEGKVYFPEQAEIAAERFFRKSNLISLRELALRVTAAYVNAQVLSIRRDQAIRKTLPTSERILVCIGPGGGGSKAIRTAKRMAQSLQAEWFAIYVETSRLGISTQQRQNTVQNLRLAEQLGAETQTIVGTDAVKEIVNYARARNVTRIIVSKKARPRLFDLLFGSFVDKLIRHSGDINILVVHITEEEPKSTLVTTRKSKIPWAGYFGALSVVLVCTILNLFLFTLISISNLILIYLLGIVFSAILWNERRGPSLLASVLSVIFFWFFFVPPRFTFLVSDPIYYITLAMMLLVAQVFSNLTIVSRQQTINARLNERRTAALFALNQQLASHRGTQQLLEIAVRYMAEIFDSQVSALLPNERGIITVRASYHEILELDSKEQSIAQWVYDLGEMAGLGTQTLPFSTAIYIPLRGTKGTVGVLRVQPQDPERLTLPDQLHLLETFSNHVALALEVDRLQEEAEKTHLKIETDRLRNTLLDSFSSDMRLPLTTIMDSANELLVMCHKLNSAPAHDLAQSIYNEAEQTERLMENLMQILRIDTGPMLLQKQPYSLDKTIHAAIERLAKRLGNKPIGIEIPDDLPLVMFDGILIEQVFVNLIENAMKFTPAESPIEIIVTIESPDVIVHIADRGPGLNPDEIEKIFEKFYRGAVGSTRGVGLGLAICKSIITAHGGRIWAENRPTGGAVFCFTLPM